MLGARGSLKSRKPQCRRISAGVVPTSLALAVVEKATELFDLDLPGEAVDNAAAAIIHCLTA